MLQMDDSQKRYAKWKKQDTKYYLLYNFIYKKCPEKANLQRLPETGYENGN